MSQSWLSTEKMAVQLGVAKDMGYAWIAAPSALAHQVGQLQKFPSDKVHRQRGASLSAFVAVVIMALILVAGLVVDGGAQAAAARNAEVAAAAAARAAADETAAARLAGARIDYGAAQRQAQSVLAQYPGISGAVSFHNGRVEVTTRSSSKTVFLSLIGIGSLDVKGAATADLVADR